jgi:hypothetical protein
MDEGLNILSPCFEILEQTGQLMEDIIETIEFESDSYGTFFLS